MSASCICHVCIINASEVYHISNILKEKERLTVRMGLVQVLGSCSHGHNTVPLCIIPHQNKQIMESLSSNLSNSGSSTNINREREYCQTARK